MDLSTTNVAGAVYDTYLNNFMNEDGSVNWLPVCADAHGFVVNKDLLNSEIAVEILNEYGFLVDTAEDGAEAVEKVKNSTAAGYDLVLMDADACDEWI